MKLFAAVVILYVSCVQSQGKSFDFKSQVGVVDVNERGNMCLIIPNAALNSGVAVNLVVLSPRQWVVKARIKEKLGESCSNNPDTSDASFYSLELGSSTSRFKIEIRQAAAIAVVSPTRVAVQNGKASVDLDKDGRREFFRDCTSNEGIHLTLWSGKPLRGKRQWHFYYYLGYDVVPSCKKKDYM
jgi:hypothetical protein